MDTPEQPSFTPAPPTSTTAIISLIAGILGLTFIPFLGSILALILGYMSKKEIEQSAGSLSGEGLATAGIVMGWVGVALGCCIAIFVALIIFGVFGTTLFAIQRSTMLAPFFLSLIS
jgi:hypothetical protein